MKKRYKILIILSMVLIGLFFWVLQPYSLNPFNERPVSLSISEVDFDCNPIPNYTERFKSKADSMLNNAIFMNDFIGVSTGIYKAGCGSWVANAGITNKQNQKTPDKETVFRIASISKPMTAIAVMQLFEKKLIDLDVPIQTYLPEFPTKQEGVITIRQLLNHTSGIKHYNSDLAILSFKHYNSLIDALDKFKDRPLSFAPGTGYEYTTYGYTILGAIIEKVTGTSFSQYMRENIFLPTGMTQTGIEEEGKRYENKADLYIKVKSNYIRSPKTDLSVKYPGGGFHSTASDLLKFGEAVLSNRLIDSTTLDMMMAGVNDLKKGTPYGFGWFVIDTERHGRILQHGGSQSGTSSYFQILLDQDIVAVTLANNFGSDDEVYWLTRDLTELVIDTSSLHNTISYIIRQDNDALNQYTGTYRFENDIIIISKDDDQLFSKLNDYPPFPIYPKSNQEYFFRIFKGNLRFIKTNDNRTIMKYWDGDENISYEKIL